MSQLPVSYTTAGAATGMAIGSIVPGIGTAAGYGVGALIGAGIDLFGKAGAIKKLEKQMKAAFYAALQKRYNQQIFSSCIGAIGSAMLYIQALGYKPTNPDGSINADYDAMLKKKLSSGNCIWNGNCNISIYNIDAQRGYTPVATISNDGTLTAFSQNIDYNNGPMWKQACHDLVLAAYQAWAEDYRDNLTFQKQLITEQDEETRTIVTKLLVNAGLMLLMLGYIIREKNKIDEIRDYKMRKWQSSMQQFAKIT